MNDHLQKTAKEDEMPRPFNVNLSTVGRFAGGGALTGVSLATTLALVRMLKDLSDKRKALAEGPAHTIILTIPKKAEEGSDPSDYPSPEGPDDTVNVGDGPATNTGIPGLATPAPVPEPKVTEVSNGGATAATIKATLPMKTPDKGDKTTTIDNSNTPEEAAKIEEPKNTDMGTGEIGTEHKDEETQPSENYEKVPDNTEWFNDLTSLLALKMSSVKRGYQEADRKGRPANVDSFPDLKKVKVTKIETPEETTGYINIENGLKNDTETGRFLKEHTVKQSNWQTFAAAMLAAGGGGAAGYALVNRIFARKRERALEGEVAKAKQEYLDILSKNGAAMEKSGAREEGSRTFGFLDYPIGMAALLYLLGAGSTAWLTKRVLDHYSQQGAAPTGETAPDIQRIVFSTEKEAADNSEAREVVEAAIGVYLDLCSGKADILGDPACKQAMTVEPGEIYKMAASDYDKLVMYLKSNPELRSTVKRLAMEKHPLLQYFKFMANWPVIGGMGDKKMFDELRRRFGPEHEAFDMIRKEMASKSAAAGDKDKNVLERLGEKLRDIKLLREYLATLSPSSESKKKAEVKEAANIAGALATGSLLAPLADTAFEATLGGGKAKRPSPAEMVPVSKEDRVQAILQDIELRSTDRNAAMFLAQNREKIEKAIRVLVEQGLMR